MNLYQISFQGNHRQAKETSQGRVNADGHNKDEIMQGSIG